MGCLRLLNMKGQLQGLMFLLTLQLCASLKHASRSLGKEGKYRKTLLNMEDIIIIIMYAEGKYSLHLAHSL